MLLNKLSSFVNSVHPVFFFAHKKLTTILSTGSRWLDDSKNSQKTRFIIILLLEKNSVSIGQQQQQCQTPPECYPPFNRLSRPEDVISLGYGRRRWG